MENAEFDKLLGDAEATFRRGLETLTQWSDQARGILHTSPGSLLTALAVSGFMTGAMLRRRSPAMSKLNIPLKADPVLLFGAGLLAGIAFGPQAVQGLAEGVKMARNNAGDGKGASSAGSSTGPGHH
jgi:hypothetical protein